MKKWQNGNNFNVHKMGLIYINARYTFLNFFCYFREKYDLDMLLRGFMSFFFQFFFFFFSHSVTMVTAVVISLVNLAKHKKVFPIVDI